MSIRSNFTICFTPYSRKIFFTNTHSLILLFSNGMIMVGNSICNFLVMLIVIRTKQISNTACKMFQISFADFLVGSITEPLYMTVLLFRESVYTSIRAQFHRYDISEYFFIYNWTARC